MSSLNNFFLVSGVGLLCLGLAMLYKRVNFVRKSKIGTGKVIDYERHELRYSKFYPVVAFNVSKNEEIIFKSAVASNTKKYKLGEEVSIRYLAENPQSAEINKTLIIWFEIPLCFVFCFVLLWLAFRF